MLEINLFKIFQCIIFSILFKYFRNCKTPLKIPTQLTKICDFMTNVFEMFNERCILSSFIMLMNSRQNL